MSNPVLIAGAGPTGLTAALELSRFGIPVRIIDKLAAPPTTSRAIGIQARTLELFEQRGLSAELVRLGNPAQGGNVYGGGKRVIHFDLSRVESRYNYALVVSQAETERIIGTAIEKQGVAIERGVELIGIAQRPLSHDPNPVTAVLRHADGRLEEVQTPWLIGAEGAHSTVRATLDLPFEGKTRDEHYALGDLLVDTELDKNYVHIFKSDFGFLGMFPMGQGRFRMVASIPHHAPTRETGPTISRSRSAIAAARFPPTTPVAEACTRAIGCRICPCGA